MKKICFLLIAVFAISFTACKPKAISKMGGLFKSCSKGAGKEAAKHVDDGLRLINNQKNEDKNKNSRSNLKYKYNNNYYRRR